MLSTTFEELPSATMSELLESAEFRKTVLTEEQAKRPAPTINNVIYFNIVTG